MKQLFSFVLIFILFSSSIPVMANNNKIKNTTSCENGECVPKIIQELEDLGKLYKKECLPEKMDESDIKKHHIKNGLSEECWKKITRINHLEMELQKYKALLEVKTGCDKKDCSQDNNLLSGQLADFSKVGQELTCSAEKKREYENSCQDDLSCVMIGSMTGLVGPFAEKVLSSNNKPKNCKLGDDNCVVQFATAFLKSAVTFFKGSWELLKKAGGAIGGKVMDLWDQVIGAEDHSSTSQLALAKASEDKDFFKELTSDFPGAMKKIWTTFVKATKEWIKSDVLCQKWSGTPHFSKCLQPSTGYDCMSCKTWVTGLCSLSGTLVAEIVPSFLTGGMITAIKHGASGAVTISKSFKVSEQGMIAIKESRVGKMASDIGISSAVNATSKAALLSLNSINKYLLSPLRKGLKSSYIVLSDLIKNGSAKLAVTPVGKFISFAGTTFATSLKVVLFPIDNPLTSMAFRAGSRSYEKALKIGKPSLGVPTAVTASIISRDPQLESLLAQIDIVKSAEKTHPEKLLKLENELLTKVEPFRLEAAKSAMANDKVNLSEVIKRLYPELQYGDLAKAIPPDKVIKAERELYLEVAAVTDTNRRALLLKKFEEHVGDGIARKRIVGDTNPPHLWLPKPMERTAALDNFDVPLTKAELEARQSIRAYMESGYKELVEKSLKTQNKIRTSSNPVVYDTVTVGAGSNNGILIGAIKETNPDLKVLVIESTDGLGTFHRVKSFDVNSADWIGDSGNSFPTSPLHVRDFNINNSAYALAEDLGHQTQVTYQVANPDILFKTTLTKVTKEPTPGAWPAKYKIETDNGLVVYARSTVVTPGLGKSVNRLKDPASVATVSKFETAAKEVDLAKDASYIPRFQDVEQYITNAMKDQKLGRAAVGRYRKKTTLLVGDGDGGSIGAEAAIGLNKNLNPPGASTDVQLVWMGQGAETGEQFVKGLSRAKQPRYSRIGKAIDDGRIKPVNGYLAKVEEFTNEAGEIQFKAYYTSKKGEAISDPIIVDNVVFATGYTHNHNTVTPYFQSLGKEPTFVPLHGKVNDYTRYEKMKTASGSEINKQLIVDGQKEDIYLAGVGGKTPISKRKMKAVTGGFLDINGARAAATGQLIARSLTPQNLTKSKMIQLLTPAKGETIIFTKVPKGEGTVLPNTEVLNIHTKLELGKSLKMFNLKPDSKFFVSVMNNEKGEMVFGVQGLNAESSKKIADALSSNPKLIDGFSQQLKVNGNRVDIMIPARSTGAIRNEGLELRTVNIYVPESIEPVSRWSSGLTKLISPSLRVSGEQKKEDQRKNEEQEKLKK